MIVLHAVWKPDIAGNLHLWAETSDRALKVVKSTAMSRTAEHPFALSPKELWQKLIDASLYQVARPTRSDMLRLFLPTTAKGPQPSPELLVEQEYAALKVTGFQPWHVFTLSLSASDALDFLLSLPTRPPAGLSYGPSLRFWMPASEFVMEMAIRQCYVPTIREVVRDGVPAFYSDWQPVILHDDMQRIAHLATMMPASCWASVASGEKRTSWLQELLLDFIHQEMNALVRTMLEDFSLLPRGVRSAGSKKSQAEQWLISLGAQDARLPGSSADWRTFASSIHSWLKQLWSDTAGSTFRICFRLDEPEIADVQGSDEPLWKLRFYLQAKSDPSLLVPAEQVWQERSDTLIFLQHTFEAPQERLLADLARAARFVPAIEESLRTAHPSCVLLSTEQAYSFLRDAAPLLEQSGFGVLVPPWWQKRSARPRVKLKVKPGSKDGSGLFGLNSLVKYDWSVAIGDTTLSKKEFEELVNLKRPLIEIRGQWVELRPEEIEAAIAFFQKKRKKEMTLGEALKLELGQDGDTAALAVEPLEAEGWIKDALEKLHGHTKLSSIKAPKTLQAKLRPYQLKGTSWLAFLSEFGFGACLADDMGLGKTIEMIALLLHSKEKAKEADVLRPTLIICPMSIVGNWQREIQRFAPSLSVLIHHGNERLSGDAFVEAVQQHDVVITTYTLALRDKEHLTTIEWGYLVLDEAQNIKNESAKQTQAIRALKAVRKIALTGTPVENRLSELWSIMDFLNPGYLGNTTDFRKNFILPIERYHNAERAEMLKQLIQPFVLRRVKTDKKIIKDLPDKMEMKVFCNLTQEQASLYEAVVKEMMEKIDESEGIERKGLILSTLMKLKQICNHPAQFLSDGSSLDGRSGKLARLEEMLEEVLAAGEKALIFTQFAEMGKLLRAYLQQSLNCETLFLSGETPKKQRDAMVQLFQDEQHGTPIFILSLKAGGVGLNLTEANHVFHFDRWWNPAVENQATDRAFRIGQKKNVQVHKYICVGTLEERIDQMIEQKKGLAESIVGSGENWLTEMSTTQLKELFALSREAVGE